MEGVGGLLPSKPPGRVQRPPTLVAPLWGATRGAGDGTATLASGNILLALIKGPGTPTLTLYKCDPFGLGGNYRQFFFGSFRGRTNCKARIEPNLVVVAFCIRQPINHQAKFDQFQRTPIRDFKKSIKNR